MLSNVIDKILETGGSDFINRSFQLILGRLPSDIEYKEFEALERDYNKLFALVSLGCSPKAQGKISDLRQSLSSFEVYQNLLNTIPKNKFQKIKLNFGVDIKLQTTESLFNYFSANQTPLFLIDGHVSLIPQINRNLNHKVCVTTVPKAGTYLFHDFLEYLNYLSTGMHIGPDLEYHDCRFQPFTLEHKHIPFQALMHTVLPSQFFVSHLPYNPHVIQYTADCKVVFLYRDLRMVLPSLMRWIQKTLEFHPTYDKMEWYHNWHYMHKDWIDIKDPLDKLKGYLKTPNGQHWIRILPNISAWYNHPGILKLNFDDLSAQKKKTISDVARYLDVSVVDCEKALSKALGTKSLTYFKERNVIPFDQELEEMFAPLVETNKMLGFA